MIANDLIAAIQDAAKVTPTVARRELIALADAAKILRRSDRMGSVCLRQTEKLLRHWADQLKSE